MTNKMALEVAISQLMENFDKMYAHNAECCPGEEVDTILQGDVISKLRKMLEQVEKKSTGAKTGKPTKAQQENEQVKLEIICCLGDEPKQIKELMQYDKLSAYSNQKLSALIRQLVAEGKVKRIEEKKVAKFTLA